MLFYFCSDFESSTCACFATGMGMGLPPDKMHGQMLHQLYFGYNNSPPSSPRSYGQYWPQPAPAAPAHYSMQAQPAPTHIGPYSSMPVYAQPGPVAPVVPPMFGQPQVPTNYIGPDYSIPQPYVSTWGRVLFSHRARAGERETERETETETETETESGRRQGFPDFSLSKGPGFSELEPLFNGFYCPDRFLLVLHAGEWAGYGHDGPACRTVH